MHKCCWYFDLYFMWCYCYLIITIKMLWNISIDSDVNGLCNYSSKGKWSKGKWTIFYCMHQNVVLHVADFLIVSKWRASFAMVCAAAHVLPEAAIFARKCGFCCNCMLVHATKQSATCHDAGLSTIIIINLLCWFIF
jgi:hypothetical protein